MRSGLIFLAVFIFSLNASTQVNTAQQYYDYILDRQVVVENALVQFAGALESDSATVMYEKLENFKVKCASAVKDLDALGSYQGNSNWKNAARDLFDFYKQLCEDEYVLIIDYSLRLTHLTDTEMKQLSEMMTVLTDEENKKVESMNVALEEFIKKFGPLKLREQPQEKK